MSEPKFNFLIHWLRVIQCRLLPRSNGQVSSLRVFVLAFVVLISAEVLVHLAIPEDSKIDDIYLDILLILVVVFPILFFMVHRPTVAERKRARERDDFHLLTSRSLRIFNSARDDRVLISSVLPRIRQKLDVSVAGVCKQGDRQIQWADAVANAQGLVAQTERPLTPNPNPLCGDSDCLLLYDLAMYLSDGDRYEPPAEMTTRGSVWWSSNRALRHSLKFVRGADPVQKSRHKCQMESLAIIPVSTDAGVNHFLIFGDPKPDAFSRERIHMLEWIANGLEMAVSRWESESKLHDLVQSLKTSQELGKLGSFEVCGSDGGHFSEELLRIIGLEASQPPACLDTLLDSIHADDRGRMEKVFAEARVSESGYDEQFRIVQPGGEVRYIHGVGGYQVELATGKAIHQGVFQDVTQRRQVEDERSQLENRMSHKHSLEIIGKLAGGVAHDFNNILTSVLCNAEILIDTFEEGVPSKNVAVEHLNAIQRSASRASRLTRQLLMFSRKQNTRQEEIVLADLVSEMVRMFQRLLPENIRITTAASSDVNVVTGDPGMLEQVLLNLVLNARDSMPSGGRLMIDVGNVDVSDEIAEQFDQVKAGSFVVLSISDTGTGMDEETLARAFQPFFTTKTPGKGTGLGLAMVEESVQKMNGFVQAKSHLGLGSIFQVYLPASGSAQPKSRPRPVLVEDGESGGEGILVCEDDAGILELTVTMLERAGYQVFAANDGSEAMKLAEQHDQEISLLITDVIMPDMSGREVAEQLHQKIPMIRTLYISGYTEDVLNAHGIPATAGAFLGKPFSSQELLQNVRKVLKRA
jgi:signal transduction histidine kinase/CheY-like chemotaxis protein